MVEENDTEATEDYDTGMVSALVTSENRESCFELAASDMHAHFFPSGEFVLGWDATQA